MGIAPLVSAQKPLHWRFLPPAGSAPALPYLGDAHGGNIAVGAEIYLGADLGWVDVSPDVLYRDGSTMVTINRGMPNEGSSPQPQTCSFQLNNRSNRYSPRNAMGPYFGKLGRNTPIRFWRMQNGIRRYRFAGEMPAWPNTADLSGNDVYTQAQAAGMLRRLQQGTPPTQSAMYRAYTKSMSQFDLTPQNVAAYWPCEDGSSASQIASGISGGNVMSVASGTAKFASDSSFQGSKALPVINGNVWVGTVGTVSTWTDNVVRFLIKMPSGGETNGAVVARFYTAGTAKRVDLIYNTASGGQLTLSGFDAGGTQLFTTGAVNFSMNGRTLRVSMALRTSGANVGYEVQTIFPGDAGPASFTGTLSGATVGAVTSVVINPSGTLTGSVFGHISVQSVWDTLADLSYAIFAWAVDATDRLVRLCTEDAINQVTVDGVPGNGYGDGTGYDSAMLMGAQLPDTLPNLLQQCIDTDGGFLYEARDQVALAWRPRFTLYNQGTVYSLSSRSLTLDYAQNQLADHQLQPQDDDLFTRNDVTVQQISGTSARQVLSDATALSVSPAPVGVGEYATTYSLSLGNDGFLAAFGFSSLPQATIADHAGWRLHLGTVNEARFPQVTINLRHPTFQNSLSLMNAALTVDIGDLIVINNPPAWLATDPIRLLILGYSETMGAFEHSITFNTVPESPYRVFVADDWVLGRADTDGSTLAGANGAADTVMTFTAGPSSAPWTVSPGDFPFDVGVGGERITVVSPVESYANDPFLAAGLAHYSGSNAALTLDVGRPFPVNRDNVLNPYAPVTLLVTPTGGASVSVVSDNYLYVDTPFNLNYTAWVWVYSETGRQYQCFINWADVNGTYLSTAFGTAVTLPVGVWTLLTAPANTRPAGAVNLSIGVVDTAGSPTSAQTFHCWGFNAAHASSLVSAGASQPYKVIRSVNGVVKAQAAGSDVRLWQPPTLSL